LFTIREELGTVTGLTITFTGDLKFGRPVHSLIKLLQFYDVRIQLVAPKALALPEDVRQQIIASGQLVVESEELTPEIVASSDILYSTRVQKERFTDLSEYERLKNTFVIDNALLKHAKSHMVVMHPLPRNAEISEEVDFDQRAAYFRQVCFEFPPAFLNNKYTNHVLDALRPLLPHGSPCSRLGAMNIKLFCHYNHLGKGAMDLRETFVFPV
jgi:carbamoyl-phosphate synthase/aspartate carbamoyltransferase